MIIINHNIIIINVERHDYLLHFYDNCSIVLLSKKFFVT